MTTEDKTTEKHKAINYEPLLYAGALCPKCGKGINNEMQIKGYEEIKERQRKRYGNRRLCNECILSYVR